MLEFDIKALFDNINHELLLRAIRKHTKCRWVLLYVQRWLTAPFQKSDGTIEERTTGTPQGGVVSPVLSNLFLHYAFDKWMEKNHPSNPFARYADDAVVHCRSIEEAEELKKQLSQRFRECKLELHPEKTKIVCCWVGKPRPEGVEKKFDFLGYCFRPRLARNWRGKLFVSCLPAISPKAAKRIRETIRSWSLSNQTNLSLLEISKKLNPTIRGWITYYGRFTRSALYPILRQIDLHLLQWVKRKYRRKGKYFKRAKEYLGRVAKYNPYLFIHWQFGVKFPG